MDRMGFHVARIIACASLGALGVACSGHHHIGGATDAGAGATGDAGTDAPPCTPFDVSIPATGVYAIPVWIGDEYLAFASEGTSPDPILHVVSSDGVLGAQFATIPQSEGTVQATGQPYAWSGSSLGVLANSANTFELVRFAHDGTRLGQTTMMKPPQSPYPITMWANDRFVVAWVDMSSPPSNTLNLQEIGPDGTLGVARQLTTTDVGSPFTWIQELASTPTSYAISLQYLTDSPVIVVIDRTTGAVQHYAPGNRFYNADLVARGPVFALLAGTSPGIFQTLDSSAVPGPIVNLPLAGLSTLLPTTTGYHVYDLIPSAGSSAMTSELDAMDLDARGFSTGPELPVSTISWGGPSRTDVAVGVFRGNGFAAYLGYGSGTTFTLRLLQQCIP